MKLLIEVVVGYMYKVQKNKLDTSKFKEEFAAIRHGNYLQFFNLIGKPIDFIVSNDNGAVSTSVIIEENEATLIALNKVGESLKDFFKRARYEFGVINDIDLTDEVFEKAALFELSLRMHSNDKRLINKEINFVDIINSLNISDLDKEVFHDGRKFINYIKRPEKLKYSWNEGVLIFNKAFELMIEKKMTII
ncbi:hypothetical protein [Flavobacterium cyclinae]|uniref:hypothetical protein n=1 Tax=Flavobacterium cyclinae TaxID=2895947 RepID=UPI001E2E530A|nr:hypothetical protein [Flavobacterium cyclinae]UGS20386.1 hypothetical protein LOS86_10165 [Flavobacterium cyclinae]